MRQRRLQRLAYLLSKSDQDRLKQIVIQYDRITMDKKATLWEKGDRELRTRVNQWQEHLQGNWGSATGCRR